MNSIKNITLGLLALSLLTSVAQANEGLLEKPRTIVVLGDSITQAGHYVTYFDAWLVKRFPDRRYRVINAGVASETVSGLSEDGHAGGRFPRPDLHERLERVLGKTKPDLVVACYGMNCGIYLPLEPTRFAKYQDGQKKLRQAAGKHGAEIVHVTPPYFDNHGKDGFNYNEVLAAYAKWLVDQRQNGWHVADLHTEMQQAIEAGKKDDPKFTVQRDRVHPSPAGHWMMAQSLIRYFGDPASAGFGTPEELIGKQRLQAVHQRMQLWLKAIHAETKPLRPGVPKGGTLATAAEASRNLEDRIYTR